MITASSPVTVTVTEPGSSLRTISPMQLRHDRDARLLDVGLDLHPVRDLEVGADELDLVTDRGDPQVLEHRQCTGAARHRALRGRDCFGKGVALAAELHLGLLGTSRGSYRN